MTKTELRALYLSERKALSPAERAEKSRLIAQHFFESVDLVNVRLLHCFLSIEKLGEVDTAPIVHALWSTAPEVRVAAPRVNSKSGELESFLYSAETELLESAWGIREPVGERVEESEIDMVLVPGLVFDLTGHRVGYGKGYYDRFLRRCRPGTRTIGLSIFEPVGEIAGIHPGDTAVDQCVIPDGIFTARSRRKEDLHLSSAPRTDNT